MSLLTEEAKKHYVKNPSECPYCNSEDISAEELDPETMSRKVNCQSDNCGESWIECLTITDVEEC